MRTGVSPPTKHQHHGHVFRVHDKNEYAKALQALDCVIQSSVRETGRISTPRLNALQRFHLEPINLVISEGPHNDSSSWSTFPAYMLSAVIATRHSYPAVLLAEQLVDQRSVHPGPLVLGTTLLKNQRL